MPATALLVIAGLIMPKPTPNNAYATISKTIGVFSLRPVRINVLNRNPAPAASNEGRDPRLPSILPESGAQIIIVMANGKVKSPAWKAENPRTCCRYNAVRNKKPAKQANAQTASTVALAKGTL